MKKVILLLVFMGSLLAFGQINPPNYKKIKKAISNKKSELYYPVLMERYLQGDSTFTPNELECLYYGFVFQKNYQPYSTIDAELRDYLKSKPTLNDEECKLALEMAKKVLEKNPFRTSAINTVIYCYDQLDSMELIHKYNQMLRMTAIAIINSGNGKSAETAFYVNEVSHEYLLTSLFDLLPKGQSLESKNKHVYDKLELHENQYGLDVLYFNIDAFYRKGL